MESALFHLLPRVNPAIWLALIFGSLSVVITLVWAATTLTVFRDLLQNPRTRFWTITWCAVIAAAILWRLF